MFELLWSRAGGRGSLDSVVAISRLHRVKPPVCSLPTSYSAAILVKRYLTHTKGRNGTRPNSKMRHRYVFSIARRIHLTRMGGQEVILGPILVC